MSNQLLASIWYDGLPGFRQMNMILQFLEVCRIGLLFPFFSLAYIICPWASWSQKLRKPFIKFICTSFSYFTFLCKYLPHRLFSLNTFLYPPFNINTRIMILEGTLCDFLNVGANLISSKTNQNLFTFVQYYFR